MILKFNAKYIRLFTRPLFNKMSPTIAINEPSIFISHVFPNKAEMVYETFAELFGEEYIDDVDVVTHELNGQEICRVYVHFKKWPSTPKFQRLRDRLMSGETVKIIYEEPWFWKCVASKLPRITSKGSMTSPPKKRIVLDEPATPAPAPPAPPAPTPATPAPVQPTAPLGNWADKVKKTPAETTEPSEKPTSETTTSIASSEKTNIEETATTPPPKPATFAAIDHKTMSDLQYQYSCYKNGLNLKTESNMKDYIGDILYPIVEKMSPVFCPKITGMMLELDVDTLVNCLEDTSILKTYIVRCYVTIQETLVSEMSKIMSN